MPKSVPPVAEPNYELIPKLVVAKLWLRDGDVEEVRPYRLEGSFKAIAEVPLSCCNRTIVVHGHVGTFLVCPGMWVIKHLDGEGGDHLGWEVLRDGEFRNKYRARS